MKITSINRVYVRQAAIEMRRVLGRAAAPVFRRRKYGAVRILEAHLPDGAILSVGYAHA